ncbi:hypothetical protein ACN20G_20025 [Streptomyces sp. BI20]|uniref:hypothetical protein n=1 Tax=Streptomyces sp. BI20 TaxID=3403460 RepID=UPI003C778E87
MGMTVLYCAFVAVALWLLAEVLLQYKARLRWRLLAFAGFLAVVAGVLLSSLVVIGAGTAAFAVGQAVVTLSFRKGFEAGWALRRDRKGRLKKDATGERHASGGRRRGGAPAPAGPAAPPVPPAPETAEMPAWDADADAFAPYAADRTRTDLGAPYAEHEDRGVWSPAAGDPSVTAPFASPFTTAEQDAHQYAPGVAPAAHPGGWEDDRQYASQGGYPYAVDPYAPQYGMDTPPGGIWVPQQRGTEGEGDPYGQQAAAQQQQLEQQQQQWARQARGEDPYGQGYPQQDTGEYGQYRP